MDYGAMLMEAIDTFFGGGATSGLIDWMNDVLGAARTVLNGGLMTTAMAAMSGIACSLMVLYFFMHLADQVNRDLFTMDKMIVMFIKLVLSFAVLANLPILVDNLIQVGMLMFNLVESRFTVNPETLIDIQVTADSINQEYNSGISAIFGFITHLPTWLLCMVANILYMIVMVIGYFISTSTILMGLARAVFCPIAVVELFEDGSRSSGVRYLKGLVADFMSLAVMYIIIVMASQVSAGLITEMLGITAITLDNVEEIFTWTNFVPLFLPIVAMVGGMAGGSKIAHDALGA